jgi:hypothetical protein
VQLNGRSVRQREIVEDWPRLFSGTEESAKLLADELDREGLHSFVQSNPGPYLTKTGYRKWTSAVLVPPDELEDAIAVAQRWRSAHPEKVGSISRRITAILVLSALLPGCWLLLALAEVVNRHMASSFICHCPA